jgi:DNA-binding SARP family transcriptional activator
VSRSPRNPQPATSPDTEAGGWREVLLSAAHQLCVTADEERSRAAAHAKARVEALDREAKLRDVAGILLRELAADPAVPRGRATGAPARRLDVRCFGAFAVELDGRRIGPWPNRRATAVFKHLVLDFERPVRREVLMDHLWPDADADAARNSLNVAVHALRRFLRSAGVGPSHVVFRDGCYSLETELEVHVDVLELRRLARRAPMRGVRRDRDPTTEELEQAAALYRGPLFEEDPYEEWTIPARRETEAIYVEVLGELRERYLAAGDHEAAYTAARKLLAIEPFREDAHRDAMVALARRGQQDLALRQFQTCATDLREHLEIAPSDETLRLRDRIRAHEPV